MKLNVWLTAAIAAVAVMGACDLPDDGGGGGGGSAVNFTRGFAFVRPDTRDIFVADESDYQTVARLTTSGNNKHPSLSHDGKQIVFVHGDGATASLQIVTVAGGAPKTLLSSDATHTRFANPVFSPDDTTIACTFERSGSNYLAIIGVDGMGFSELSDGVLSYASPSFYPDGTAVLVAAGNLASGYSQLEKVDLATGNSQNVMNGLGNEAQAIRNRVVISPDGKKAAFDGQLGSGVTRIFVADLGSGQVTQLTDNPSDTTANDSFPSWFGSTEVAFSSDTGGSDQVYTLPASSVKQTGSLTLPSAIEAWFGP